MLFLMDLKKYIGFTIEDYLNDDDFLRYVINPSEEDLVFWTGFINNNPSRAVIIQSASKLISTYRKQETFYNEKSQQAVFERISSTINASKSKKLNVFRLGYVQKIAASFFLFLLAGVMFYLYASKVHQDTEFGQVKTILLPDSSVVILNGNSKIVYARNFRDGIREVWLTGEGLFKVKHINNDPGNIKPMEKFIVHSSDLNIEVLGTTFNVKNRRNKTSVGLISGKIQISYPDLVQSKNKNIVLTPGDYLQHGKNVKTVLQRLADPEKLTLWVNHHLAFKNPTIKEIALVLEDELGYQVRIENDSISTYRIEGEINVSDVNDLFRIISDTHHIRVLQEDKTITIKH